MTKSTLLKIGSGMALLGFTVAALAAEPVSALREGDRIVVVGDSITGQSAGANGYVGLMKEALDKAHPGGKFTLVPLGGSGQTVGSWVGMEIDSRTRNFKLDVPEIDVKTTLDGGAEVVVIMLGMNNVLRPDTDDSPEAIANWTRSYHALIAALRARTHPRVIALATPTLCSEDEAAPKNQLLDKLSGLLASIAVTDDCLILPVRASFKEMLRDGRSYRSDFHVTNDYVHPNPAGHLAIATAMLEGLGEPVAAKALYDECVPQLWQATAGTLPALSFQVEPVKSNDLSGARETFKIRYWLNTQVPRSANATARVVMAVPEGWSVIPDGIESATGEFTASGPLDRLRNVLTLSATHDKVVTRAEVVIPAPWLVGVGNNGRAGWVNEQGFKFDPVAGRLPIDAELSRGRGFGQPVPGPPWYRPLTWHRYIASVNHTGGADPGSVDVSAISWFGVFDVAYGVRWIYSPSPRSVSVKIDSHAFAGDNFLTVWLNGDPQWTSSERTGTFDLKLRQGWNACVFKSNHLEWQWQFEIQLLPSAQVDLSDLRFSTSEHDLE